MLPIRCLFVLATLTVLLAGATGASDNQPDPANPPVNTWAPLGDGTFALPEKGWPNLTGPRLVWVPEQDRAIVVPLLGEGEAKAGAGFRAISFEKPAWTFEKGTLPKDLVPNTTDSPKAYIYLPGLKKVFFAWDKWWYSRDKKTAVEGWLLNPADGAWEILPGKTSMSDRSADYSPAPGRDGGRLPLWGSICYDAHNKEAVAFGGGGVWGRVAAEKTKVGPGDWIYDETAKYCRRLTADDDGKISEALRWYPAHVGTWTFGEATKQWSAIGQPMHEQPGGRILPGMAYDAGHKKIVLFGGDDLARCLNDTWVYDCATKSWKEITTEQAPHARAGHAMVYVPEQKVILLAGGYAGGWRPLKDVWAFDLAKSTWTRLDLDLPHNAGHASADYDAKRGLVILAAFPGTRGNKKVPVYTLKLDRTAAKQSVAEAADPVMDWHCKAWKSMATLLPDEWEAGKNKSGDPEAGSKELAALPANTWVKRKSPTQVPNRGWGSYVYDIKTHKGFAWGGGHSAYPGAEISEYDVLTNHMRSMAQATNYNPIWLHGMVAGPPGLTFGGWSFLPSHARKSYGVDPISGCVVTFAGDVYDPRHHAVTRHIGDFPMSWGGPSYQVAYVTAPHGLYAFASTYGSKGTGWLCKANVAEGKWEVIDKSGPNGHNEHDYLVYDSKRDRLLYINHKGGAVRTFDFKTKAWGEEATVNKAPSYLPGDGTYIPEMDAMLTVSGKGKETMYFYKCDEKKWYSAPYEGDAAWRGNSSGRDFSPIYDPELKLVVRFYPDGYKWLGVNVLRLDPVALKLTPLE